MKILKVYDKINRNVLHTDQKSGSIIIREFPSKNEYALLMINTKIFKSKNDKVSYLSYAFFVNDIAIQTLDLTKKYLVYQENDLKGNLKHFERLHIKDSKSFLIKDRIYDENEKFIEIENHKGKKTAKFQVKENFIQTLINNNHGRE